MEMNIEEILKKHVGEDGKLNIEAAAKELKEEQGRAFVPKADFNSKNEELKTANATLESLKKDNKDNESLQTKVGEYESTIQGLQEELAGVQKTAALKDALTKAGAKDIEYMIYKLGDVEVNKDGTIKDLENKIKSLKEATPDFFESKATESKNQDPAAPGYKVVDNKLDKGKVGTTYSFDELSKLTPEEINNNWEAVSAALEQGDDK